MFLITKSNIIQYASNTFNTVSGRKIAREICVNSTHGKCINDFDVLNVMNVRNVLNVLSVFNVLDLSDLLDLLDSFDVLCILRTYLP